MNKTKILILFGFFAMLFACGSQEDHSGPAKLKRNLIVISPFDTLKAEFDSKIAKIDTIIYQKRNATLISEISEQKPSDVVKFLGTHDVTGSGLKHFEPYIFNDSIVFKNVLNDYDYIQKEAVLYYSTYPILDSPGNNETPDNIEQALGRNTITAKGVTFAGVVGVKDSPEWVDLNDYFELTTFKAYDSLFITLNNAAVNLMLITPKDTIMPIIKNNAKFIEYEIDPRGIVTDTKLPIELKIRVFSTNRPTPYLLTVRAVECPECRLEKE